MSHIELKGPKSIFINSNLIIHVEIWKIRKYDNSVLLIIRK